MRADFKIGSVEAVAVAAPWFKDPGQDQNIQNPTDNQPIDFYTISIYVLFIC